MKESYKFHNCRITFFFSLCSKLMTVFVGLIPLTIFLKTIIKLKNYRHVMISLALLGLL